MRPGQNNKQRMRGRNNRKSPNPLTRSYESNGPDVKIRGTAHHVAEKYLQLARDAQSSGDPVMAESYLQHAEHYFRLIASAYAAQQQSQSGYQRGPNEALAEEDDDDDDFGGLPDRFASPPERVAQPPYAGQQSQPAPHHQPQPAQSQPQPYQERGFQNDRQQHQDRSQQNRGDRPNGQDRNNDRPYQDRNNQNRFNQNRNQRDNRPNREFRIDQQPQPRIEQPAPEAIEPVGLPSFITAPLRVPQAESPQPLPENADQPREDHQSGGFHLRPRRRRNRNDEDRGGETRGVAEMASPAADEPTPQE